MSQTNLTMQVRRPRSSVCVIDIQGEITAQAEQALTNAYGEADTPGIKAIVLNFSELEYMNSGGIGLLVTLLIRANRNNQQLLATGLSDHYQEIFEVTRLNEAIRVCSTEAAALTLAGVG